MASLTPKRGQPVVEDEELGPGEPLEELGIPPVALGDEAGRRPLGVGTVGGAAWARPRLLIRLDHGVVHLPGARSMPGTFGHA